MAAKPQATPKTPTDARIPLILISARNIKYAPKIPIAIFPKLLKRPYFATVNLILSF